jgi:hypothetical protein
MQERISDKEVKAARTTSERERGDFSTCAGDLCPFPDLKLARHPTRSALPITPLPFYLGNPISSIPNSKYLLSFVCFVVK